MFGHHPYDCTKRKYPTDCRYCGQRVVYWECYCGSKVFFDPPNFGKHQCRFSAGASASANRRPTPPQASGRTSGARASANPYPPRASGKIALTTLSDISVSLQPDDYGLMPGMERVVSEIGRSWDKMSESGQRATERMNPYGDKSETIVGEVSDMSEIDFAAKFGIAPNSIGGGMLGETFPGLRAAQITILVDESLNDPDAVDKMSYTAWCPPDAIPGGLAKRALVEVNVAPRELPIIGRKWVVESV